MIFADNVSVHIYGKDLFTNISFSMESSSKKKIALVGYNGVGKSSFFKVLTGEIESTAGTLSTKGEILGYLPQDQDLPTEGMVLEYLESLLEESWMTYQIDILVENWGISSDLLLKNLNTLSGGERIRVAMLALMLTEPTVLLLDEPTNHLDNDSLDWLGKVIQDFNGSVFLISHDRSFISTYMNEIWEIGLDSSITRFQGKYDEFIVEKERLYQKRLQEYDACKREVDAIVHWLKVHEFHPKYQFSELVLSRKRALELARKNMPPKPIPQQDLKFSLPTNEAYQGRTCAVNIAQLEIEGTVLSTDIHFTLRKSERVHVIGPNGSGKSTLLRRIMAASKDTRDTEVILRDGVRIGYLSQYSALPEDLTLLQAVETMVPGMGNKGRHLLAYYRFRDDDVFKKVGDVSLGERKRLELAIILSNKPNFLILDEPTNHLDIYAREDMERFLQEVKIPMIIVSHDQYFVAKMHCDQEVSLLSQSR